MPIAKTVYIYKFDELSDDAKENALNNVRSWPDLYAWGDDNLKTLQAFENQFPIKHTDFEYGAYRGTWINARVNIDDEVNYLRGLRLRTYILNNFYSALYERKYLGHLKSRPKFTPVYSKIQYSEAMPAGYAMDCAIREPLYKFIKHPDKFQSLEDILKECLESWVHACNNDYESCYEDDAVIDFINSNEYDFTEEGELA